ncbi:MAG: DUF2179 domain-containing protein [Lachnospiraceae bacterium]
MLDHFIFAETKRRICTITKYEQEVREFILHALHSGASFYEAIGAYNMEKYREIITIVDKNEYQKLMNYIITRSGSFYYGLHSGRYALSTESQIVLKEAEERKRK